MILEFFIQHRTKRQSIFDIFKVFSPRRPTKHQSSFTSTSSQSSYAPPAQSSYAAPPSYEAPSYEPPPRVIYRKFGYVCEITVSETYCLIGKECDKNGNRLFKNQWVFGLYYKTLYGSNLHFFCNKQECLSLGSLSSLVWYLRVRPEAYPREKLLKSSTLR
jgi:hypothetical protein